MQENAVLQTPEEVLRQYGDMVLRTAFALVKNRYDAEDIAQEVLISLMRKKPVFISAEHQKAWLLRVTINRSKSFLKSGWQKKTQELPDTLKDRDLFSQIENTVLQAVGNLPVKYRQVIYLYYIEGYAAIEIAKLLRIPQNTVLSQMARARKMLKKQLEGELADV